MPSELPARLADLIVAPGDGPAASLVSALAAMLDYVGMPADRHAVAAMTGIAFHTSYCPTARPECRWNTYGLDAFLAVGALRLGLELRDLHPPDAAPLPATPPEYDGHFRDSYLPFVESALSRGEPVLGWMGWPGPAANMWGIITGLDPATRRCSGSTAMSGPRPVVMDASPVAVYTIVGVPDAVREPAALFDAVAGQARRLVCNELDPRHGVQTGIRALERLAESVAAPARKGAESAASLDRVLTDRIAGCESAVSWLGGIASALDAPRREIAQAWRAGCLGQGETAREYLQNISPDAATKAIRGIIENDNRIAEMLRDSKA